MASLKDTTVTDLVSEQDVTVDGILQPSSIGIYGFKSDGGGSNTESGPINWNGIRHNSGISISNSNSRFTVPDDGFYFVSFRNIGNNQGVTDTTWLAVNGGTSGRVRAYGRANEFNYPMTIAFSIYNLSAGDYIEYIKNTAAMYQSSDDYTQFAIFKVA